ncbi:MAG: hypothetical protein WDA16_01435 [Candidatus Thermoplasmatota archaeon]
MALGVLASLTLGASAFNWGSVSARTVTITLVGDSSAYLSIAATSGGAHACFVSTVNGKVTLKFDSSCGGGVGTGLGAGDGSTSSRYSKADLNDILTITDQGDRTVDVYVNATTSSGSSSSVKVQTATSTGTMTDGSYSTAATMRSLVVGGAMYVGVQVNSGTVASGQSVSGTITIDARATA